MNILVGDAIASIDAKKEAHLKHARFCGYNLSFEQM